MPSRPPISKGLTSYHDRRDRIMGRMTVDFSGAAVFVAGGTSGINLGIAEGFAAAGARVAVMSRSQ